MHNGVPVRYGKPSRPRRPRALTVILIIIIIIAVLCGIWFFIAQSPYEDAIETKGEEAVNEQTHYEDKSEINEVIQ